MLDRITGIKVGDIIYAEYHTPSFRQVYGVLGRVSHVHDHRTITIILLDTTDDANYSRAILGCETHVFTHLTFICEVIPITHTCNKEMIDLLDEMCWC